MVLEALHGVASCLEPASGKLTFCNEVVNRGTLRLVHALLPFGFARVPPSRSAPFSQGYFSKQLLFRTLCRHTSPAKPSVTTALQSPQCYYLKQCYCQYSLLDVYHLLPLSFLLSYIVTSHL